MSSKLREEFEKFKADQEETRKREKERKLERKQKMEDRKCKKDIEYDKVKDKYSKIAWQLGGRNKNGNRNISENALNNANRNYTRIVDSIPRYISNNLKQMPNNKGYIWKHIYLYGELDPIEGEPTVLFEKKYGGELLIHEWTATIYTIFEKKNKDTKKELIHREPIKRLNTNTNSLANFIKT